MNKCPICFTCDEAIADATREFARSFFRQARLRCTTERSYPESGWCSPATGASIEVWITVRVPEGQRLRGTALRHTVRNFGAGLNARFGHVENFSTVFQ